MSIITILDYLSYAVFCFNFKMKNSILFSCFSIAINCLCNRMPVSICNVKRYNNDRQSYGRLINEFWNFKIDCIKRRHRIWYINLVMVLCNSNNNNSCSNNSLNKIAFLTTMATIFRFLAAMQLLSKCFSVIDYF